MTLNSKIEISVKCRNLKKRDLLSASDPFCVLYSVPPNLINTTSIAKRPSKVPSIHEKEIGRTEVLYDTHFPEFVTRFRTDYYFEKEQAFILRVFDEDKKGIQDVTKHDYLGGTAFNLGQLFGALGNSLARPLHKGKGYVILQGEEVSSCADLLHVIFSGHDLKNMDGLFGKSDPFIQVESQSADGKSWNPAWKSEIIMNNNKNPKWKPAKIPIQTICNGDLYRKIRIHILDWDRDGKTDDMGAVETSVADLIKNTHAEFPVMRYSKRKRITKQSGKLEVNQAKIIEVPTMIDYISGGCEITLQVAVDFTASNGAVSQPGTLHHRDRITHKLNDYQAAIQQIGSILQDYSLTKEFRMYGFGAAMFGPSGAAGGKIKHEFFPMGSNSNGVVVGVDGLLHAYEETFQRPGFDLYGPTNFAPVISPATQESISQQHGGSRQSYSILCILTDGAITDLQQTIQCIVEASHSAPMSIIIIGVGQANFDSMEALDADVEPLRDARGRMAARDIVQFVPFRQFRGDAAQLASETLKEVPEQLVQYFYSRGIPPMEPVAQPQFEEEEIFLNMNFEDEDEIDLSH